MCMLNCCRPSQSHSRASPRGVPDGFATISLARLVLRFTAPQPAEQRTPNGKADGGARIRVRCKLKALSISIFKCSPPRLLPIHLSRQLAPSTHSAAPLQPTYLASSTTQQSQCISSRFSTLNTQRNDLKDGLDDQVPSLSGPFCVSLRRNEMFLTHL